MQKTAVDQDSVFSRFEKFVRRMVAVPKKEIDQKAPEFKRRQPTEALSVP